MKVQSLLYCPYLSLSSLTLSHTDSYTFFQKNAVEKWRKTTAISLFLLSEDNTEEKESVKLLGFSETLIIFPKILILPLKLHGHG